jgi:hypothetical protein
MSINDDKLKALHEKFNMAEESINKMTEVIEVLDDDLSSLEVTEIQEPGEHLPADLDSFEEVFTLDLLKQDFMAMRTNILAVINRGQNILEDTGNLDIGDMKASQLEALSSLQRSTGENIKLLMGIYKDIIAVEKDKYVLLRGLNQENLGANPQSPINVAEGGSLTQNVIVAGSTHDILRLMEDAKNEKENN